MEDNNVYELAPMERDHIEGLLGMQKRLEGELMGALAMLCKQHGLEPSRSAYKNGLLTTVGPQRLPAAPQPPLPIANGSPGDAAD
jgi:hypothetical protein